MPDNEMVAPDSAAGLKQRSVRGAAVTLVAQGARFILQLGSQIALARLLLPAQFGLMAMIAPLLAFIGIFNELGLSQATIQRKDISQQELSNLFWVNVVVSTGLAGVMCATAPFVALFYGDARLTGITMWLSGLLVVAGLSAQPLALLNRHMRFIPLATIDVACTVMSVAVGITCAWQGLGYWSLVMMQAANGVTILAMAWAWLQWWPSLPRSAPGTLSLLRFGSHITGYNLITFAGNNLDNILIGKLSGTIAVGLYDRAFKLVSAPMWTIMLPVARIADSLLARLQTAPDRYRKAFMLMLQALFLITVPAVAVTATTAKTLVLLLFGSPWINAAPIVAWLAIAVVFAPLSLSSSWLFVSQGRAAEQTRFACLRTGLSIAAVLAGLPWGAAGVARSYAVFGLLIHGLPLWAATRRGPVTRGDVIRTCYPIAVGGLVAMAVVGLLEQRLTAADLPGSICFLSGIPTAYLSCIGTMLLFPNGLRLLKEFWLLWGVFRGGSAIPI